MSDEGGCLLLALVVVFIGVAFVGGCSEGVARARGEFHDCLSYRAAAPSDTVVLALHPKCEKWLRPEAEP